MLVSSDVLREDRPNRMRMPAASTVIDAAIERAQSALLAAQAPDGHWVGQLEANTTITSEYLLFCHMIDRVDRERAQKIVHYLRWAKVTEGGVRIYSKG